MSNRCLREQNLSILVFESVCQVDGTKLGQQRLLCKKQADCHFDKDSIVTLRVVLIFQNAKNQERAAKKLGISAKTI